MTLFERVFEGDQTGGDGKPVYPVRVISGLNPKTLKALRKIGKGRQKRPSSKAPMNMLTREPPYFNPRLSAMQGPGSFGPVSVGGIMTHS